MYRYQLVRCTKSYSGLNFSPQKGMQLKQQKTSNANVCPNRSPLIPTAIVVLLVVTEFLVNGSIHKNCNEKSECSIEL